MAEPFIHFFGGSPLNRLGWLRTSQSFLNAVIISRATRWVLFNNGQPLLVSRAESKKTALAYLSTNDVRAILGPEPFFGQGKEAGEAASTDIPALEAARHRGPPIVFLGLHEPDTGSASALPSSDFKDPHAAVANLQGVPYFSVDIGELGEESISELLKNSESAKGGEILTWSEPRSAMSSLDAFSSGIFAQARSVGEWNQRNKFCPACGSPHYSVWGGWKLSCVSLLPWSDNTNKKPCATVKGLHNFTHPRTDPVAIIVTLNDSRDKVLLGRSKNFPPKLYSALAGFLEPAESFEDAVKREMWEEAGVKVWDVRYHSGQPWPYPSSLMIGFYATADSSQPIRTDLDSELEDARWYTREEILTVMKHPAGNMAVFGARDQTSNEDLTFRLPPLNAMAGVLIKQWAEDAKV